MCKHPMAHVSSPSLPSLLILNQRRLILHCHVCCCPLERPLVVICTWLWLLQELENSCMFFPGKCRGLWQEAETQFIWHHTWLHTPTAATDHGNSPVSWRPVREEFTRPERHGHHQTADVRHLNIAGLYVLCLIIAIQEPNNFGVNLKIPQNSHLTFPFLSSHNEAQWRIDRRVCFYWPQGVDCAVGKVGTNAPELYITCNVLFPLVWPLNP